MVEKEEVLTQLDEVEDPELELSIVELGLVYDVRFEQKDEGLHAEIDLTLTSPGCPAAPEIMAAAHRAALNTEGLESVHINLVWTPRWDPKKHASEDARMDMGIWD
ncbi:MAG: metal-sulfur cluster biosynthetic enzyme [Euryarchaeota archaeon]|nr:metal-sulfur cluster biosynthetic enzyme [Euryarchaeota archaeon]|tara:strand:+ start:16139 stop:16456 length:318 start_codon:yes stop_codon:yes gene_type:complete